MPPTVPSVLLHRTSLVNMLDGAITTFLTQEAATPCKLVLINAPAGYGKTVLLTDFAQRSNIACCWYFLDASDREPPIFIRTLIASIHQRFPAVGQALNRQIITRIEHTAAHTIQIEEIEHMLDMVIQVLKTDITQPFALLFCNYHEINDNETMNRLFNRLIAHLPAHGVVVIESRLIPSLELASLAVRRQVFGLGKNHLAFTANDIQALAHLLGLTTFSAEEARRLSTAFDGWIAGILLGTRLGNLPDVVTDENATLLADRRQYLFAYLVNEVFQQKPELFTFLKETSLLQHMTSELCNALPGISNAASHLENAEQQGFFVIRSCEGKQTIYTCQPMVRELLYESFRLQDPARLRLLHRKAARLLAERNERDQAVAHALAAEDYDFACILLEEYATSLLRQGRGETLQRWIEALPETVRATSPRLLLSLALLALASEETNRAVPLLKQAQALVEQSAPAQLREPFSQLQAEILVAQSRIFFGLGEYSLAQRVCQQALVLLPDDEQALRAMAHQGIGTSACLLGNIVLGITELQRALQLWGHNTEIPQTAYLHGHLANAYDLIGNYALSEHHRTRAIASCERLGDKRNRLKNVIGLAITWRNKGALDNARDLLHEALATARADHLQTSEAYALANLGEIYLDQDQLAQALVVTEDALTLARQLNDHHLINATLHTLSLTYLFLGDPATPSLLVEQIEVKEDNATSYSRSLRDLTCGTIYLRQKRYQEAIFALQSAIHIFEQSGLKRLHLRALLRLAACYSALQDFTEVARLQEQAATLVIQYNAEHIALIEQRRFPGPGQTLASSLANSDSTPPEAQHMQASAPVVTLQAQPSLPRLRIQAFGEPCVQINDVPVTRWRMARSMELYFFLLDQKKALHKELIIEKLWPDADENIDQTLRSTIYYLRKALGESCVIYRNGAYMLNLSAQYDDRIWYDVDIFESCYVKARQARAGNDDASACIAFERMIQLYSGDYVQSFYSNWCVMRRDELRRIYLEARRELALIAWRNEEFDASSAHWQHMLAVDRCLEDAHYGLMRCYLRQGKRSLALRQYQRCVDALQEELAALPGAAIQKLYQRIIAGAEVTRA